MIKASEIRNGMDVMDSDGASVGQVDSVNGNRIKLTRLGSADGEHHYIDLADVARVDDHVHLSRTRAAVLGTAAATTAGTAGTTGALMGGGKALWWILGALAVLALLFALSQCDRDRTQVSGTDADDDVTGQRVAGAPLRDGSLAYNVDQFLAGKDGTPRTFTFDNINFDSGTATLREEERGDLDDLARVLAAYPGTRGEVVGYTDAKGPAAANQALGQDRAKAVVAALAARGVDAKRLEARSGGESNPAATNASDNGRFENRRTELIILDR
ncbi:MAG: DUF2171 domain-containing protein [Sphingomicrobium sp.]